MPGTIPEIALVMFIGMGPVKVLALYLGATRHVDAALGRRVAFRAVATATIVTLGLLLVGSLLMRLLHFSSGSLIIAGGIVLLAYGIQTVLDTVPGTVADVPPSEATLMRMAVTPMGLPLILNPAGIAAATIFSAEATNLGDLGVLGAIVLLVAVLDVVVLVVARPIGPRLPTEATVVLEKLLGILLAAVAVELILTGLVFLGLLDLTIGH
jgi:small neutral amino acid transporter SnatA (MarC family)